MSKVGAILVVYNFKPSELTEILKSLVSQTDCVCVVDNSETDNHAIFEGMDKVVYFPEMRNSGIAAAQNAGIQYLIDNDYDYAIFSDQDSLVAEGTVKLLLDTYLELQQQGYNVGAVGPRAYNKVTGMPYPHQCNRLGELVTPSGAHVTEVTFTMSSLSLQSVDTFRKVGLMDAALFIDGVDSEWCWRGRYKLQLRYFVNEDIHIDHLLGLGTKNVGGKNISITPPYRMRYMYRNYLWLLRRRYTPRKWLVYNGLKYIAKIFYYTAFSRSRMDYLRNISRGISEGLKQK